MSAKPPPQGNSPLPNSNPPPQPTLTATAPVSSLLPQIPSQPAAVLALLTAQMQQQQQAAAAAAQSQLLAARAAPSFLSSSSNVQDMSLEQLEQHVGLIQQLGQTVPQNVMMLLQDARKRAEKREAKRLANRKSASTSRARKKALVKEMTEMNVRLRRQALILSLLPDLVLAVTEQGKVTFCGPQVDRVLQYSPDDLLQSKGLFQYLVPESQRKLQRLIHQHFHPNQKLPAAAMAQQFPLSVVNLDSVNSDENDTSDTSAASNGKQPSSLTDSKAANSDDSEERQPQQPRKKRRRYQDDVTGATVTANNADARLSSLAHTSTTSSEDNDTSSGGYRAQTEDTSSSDDAAESEPDGRRRIPFSLTCTVCLVRRDRSTVWCEVTSSMHTTVVSPDGSNATTTESNASVEAADEKSAPPPEPEILLCLRPFREGEKAILVSDSPDDSNENAVVESLISMSSSQK